DMLAIEIGDYLTAAIFLVDDDIVVRIGCGCVNAFANRTLDHDIGTVGCAFTLVGKGSIYSIKVYHQIIEFLIVGLSQHRPAVKGEILKTDTAMRDLFGLKIVRRVSGKLQIAWRLVKEP